MRQIERRLQFKVSAAPGGGRLGARHHQPHQTAAGGAVVIGRWRDQAAAELRLAAIGQRGHDAAKIGEKNEGFSKCFEKIRDALADPNGDPVPPSRWSEEAYISDADRCVQPYALRLPADLPVRGKVVDLEGKAVAGATVRIVELSTTESGTLDEFVKRLVDEGAVGRVGIVRRRHCIGVLFNQGFVEGPTRWHVSSSRAQGRSSGPARGQP